MIKKNNYKTKRVYFLWRECAGILVCALAIFLLCALYSYCPYDISLLYYSTDSMHNISNVCGAVGAHSAALSVYFFGCASLLLVGVLFFIAHCLLFGRSWRSEWERFIALGTLMCAVSAWLAFYSVDFLYSTQAGGLVGMYVNWYLQQLFGYIGTLLCIHMCLYVSFIIVFRFSFMSLGYYGAHCVGMIYRWCDKYQVLWRMSQMIQWCLLSAYQCIQIGVSGVKNMLSGVIFLDTGLMVPQEIDVYIDNEDSFIASEQVTEQKSIDILKEDIFWQENENAIVTPRIKVGHHNEYEDAEVSEVLEQQLDDAVHSEQKKYQLPNLDIFVGVENERDDVQVKKELEERANLLQEKLQRFGILGTVVAIKRGPVVTLFEYKPDMDTKISKILARENDLVMALRAHSVRILAPIPGKSVVGFEVANIKRLDVLLADIIKSDAYTQSNAALPLILGKDIIGSQVVVDLARMPHLLVAGSTGSGKSVALNAMLVSLLCACNPEQLKLILIDPKRLEFSTYADIAHLLFPIVVDMKKVTPILRWVVQQMETRYERMAAVGARNIFDYNNAVGKGHAYERMPFIVVMIDELADLMMTVGREVEDLITRITQMARAAGIHMIVATQRPSVDVITGLIKVNFPSRISFRVTSRVDSRTILDCGGADKLLGRGDMLFLDSTTSTLSRVHGAYVSDEQIEQVVAHIKNECEVEYLDLTNELQSQTDELDEQEQQLYEQVIEFLKDIDAVSISLLQRKFKIGYNRSARIIDMLESHGLIMPASGSKTRRVIK